MDWKRGRDQGARVRKQKTDRQDVLLLLSCWWRIAFRASGSRVRRTVIYAS